jgi:hypothetical protein
LEFNLRTTITPTMRLFVALLLALASVVSAQFGFFDHMFHGGQQHHQQPQNVPSDSSNYRAQYLRARCDKYLCPDTLGELQPGHAHQRSLLTIAWAYITACVHFPHHCPCPWPAHEDKFELAEGQRICISKGGFKAGEAARKVELARKGLL